MQLFLIVYIYIFSDHCKLNEIKCNISYGIIVPYISIEYNISSFPNYRAVEKRGQGDGRPPYPPPPPPTISQTKQFFSHVKSENIKFLHVITCESIFIEQDISDKKQIGLSEFAVLAINGATTVTNNKFVSFCFR